MLELDGISLSLERVKIIEKKSRITRSTPAKCLNKLKPAWRSRSILRVKLEVTASGILRSSRIEK